MSCFMYLGAQPIYKYILTRFPKKVKNNFIFFFILFKSIPTYQKM